MASDQAVLAGSEKKSLRVLVTGFRPFDGAPTNPSWLAAKPLDNQTLTFTQPAEPSHPHAPKPLPVEVGAHISALEFQVTYSDVLNRVPGLHKPKQYDVIFHVGVGSEGGFAIERLAHKTGYITPDERGLLCDPVNTEGGVAAKGTVLRGFGVGYEEFGDELKTGVDVDAVVEHLKSKGLDHTSPSDDPGRFICDFIYYCSLACAKKEKSDVKVLFMHVPPEGSPYQVEDMTRAITGVIEYFALHA